MRAATGLLTCLRVSDAGDSSDTWPTTPVQSLLYPNCSSPLSKVIVEESLQDWCRMDLPIVNIGEGEGTRCSGRSNIFIFNLAADGREES